MLFDLAILFALAQLGASVAVPTTDTTDECGPLGKLDSTNITFPANVDLTKLRKCEGHPRDFESPNKAGSMSKLLGAGAGGGMVV